jgi:CheY-like chemotaxis protein
MKPPLYFLVDDDPINNMINERMLRKHFSDQLTVEVFPDGQPVIDRLRSGGEMPSLIFLDINMPGLDGWQFLEAYEKDGFDSAVVMLTSSIDPGDPDRSQSFPSVVDFISKPLMPASLTHLMGHLNQES